MLDVVIVGSGYAGSALAARLAPRARVLVVERGRRWQPGEFPVDVAGLWRAYRSARNPGGLWSLRLGAGTGVAVASALGGSSTINYGITARPDDHVFDGWPVTARQLALYFERARAVLQPSRNPLASELGDQQFLDRVEPGRRVDLENTIDWTRCDQCGRCVPGCNRGAKRTLADNYLPLAIAAGAEVRVETEVHDLVPCVDGHAVELRRADGTSEWVRARTVILAAGTLGTLELIHRARLPVGPRFGRDLSLNGDGLAFLYDTPMVLSSHHGAPISTSVRIPFVDAEHRARTLMVMSGRVPMAAMRFTAAALAVGAELLGEAVPTAAVGAPGRWRRRLRDLRTVDADGALTRTFMYKLDGQDAARGTARFTARGAVIDWPDYADDPILRFAEERLRTWAARVGGTVIAPVARLPGHRGWSVHPLGGCRMGRDRDDGVVDEFGRVFAPDGGVIPGLRVADASIIRGALGVPPSWTIAALAERVAEHAVAELQR